MILPPEEVACKEEFEEVSKNLADEQKTRKFVFAEFFAGMGGFSEAMKLVGKDFTEVRATLDGYAGEWNILAEEDYNTACILCENELDHAHFAPACRTMSMARRSDRFGSVKILRDEARPEGYGHPDAEESNEMVRRMVLLCLMLHKRGSTFAIENPWMSYLWLLKSMQKLMKIRGVELICLHQCAYGASSVKPTGILTGATWMKLVRRLCHEVRDHLHAHITVWQGLGLHHRKMDMENQFGCRIPLWPIASLGAKPSFAGANLGWARNGWMRGASRWLANGRMCWSGPRQ